MEQKDNSGALFVNDKKEKETHPDRKGSAVIDGVEYWVSGWLNESKNGVKYLGLAFNKKEEVIQEPEEETSNSVIEGDDIPFVWLLPLVLSVATMGVVA